jgi:ubiquitin C-terminal hydrolase
MSAGAAPKKGKKNRKHGRNKAFCASYRAEGREDVNRAKRLYRYLRSHPTDPGALAALSAIDTTKRQRARKELRSAGFSSAAISEAA